MAKHRVFKPKKVRQQKTLSTTREAISQPVRKKSDQPK